MCYTIEVQGVRGFGALCKRLLRRIGLVIGLAAFVAMLTLYSSVLWHIDIECSDQALKTRVEETLQNAGVRTAQWSSSLDVGSLKRDLERLDGVSAVNIGLRGVALEIEIVPSTVLPPVPPQNDGDNIVATVDCRVTKVSVLSGTALVKPGDIVKKGAVMIAAYKIDESSGKPVQIPTRAQGEIYGDVWYTSTEIFTPVKLVTERTGRVLRHKTLLAFGTQFLWSAPDVTFAQSEATESTVYLCHNNFLPFRIKTTSYYETVQTEQVLDFELQRENLEIKSMRDALALVPTYATVAEQYNHVSREQSFIRVQGIARASQTVSERGPFKTLQKNANHLGNQKG